MLNRQSNEKVTQFENGMKKTQQNSNNGHRLFPYKYYLLSLFFKNLNMNKCFDQNFKLVYDVFSSLFDVNTYFKIQKELNVIKNFVIDEDWMKEEINKRKINVYDRKVMNACKNDKEYNLFNFVGGLIK